MKKYLTTVIVTLTTMICLGQGSEPYKYIWAKGGINLRQNPSTTSRIISKVPFGDSLTILNTTRIGFAYLLTKAGKERRRLLLQSRWVKVAVNNEIGYMTDGYILDYPCPRKNESLTNYLDRLSIKDKASDPKQMFEMNFGIARFECNRMKLHDRYTITFKNQNEANEVYQDNMSSIRYYQGFSTSILIVFLDPFFNILSRNGKKLKVSSSWENYLNIWDSNIENADFTLLDNGNVFMDFNSTCY
ncbi:MAG: hypothetical protein ACJA1A_002367 [Saprospiraceae bacterium]|jgi:hypothetical protein